MRRGAGERISEEICTVYTVYSVPRKRDRNRRKKKMQEEETRGRKQQKGEEADTGGGSRNRKGNIERQQK